MEVFCWWGGVGMMSHGDNSFVLLGRMKVIVYKCQQKSWKMYQNKEKKKVIRVGIMYSKGQLIGCASFPLTYTMYTVPSCGLRHSRRHSTSDIYPCETHTDVRKPDVYSHLQYILPTSIHGSLDEVCPMRLLPLVYVDTG